MVREREWKIRACSTCTVENDNGFMKITFLRSCNTNRLDNFPMYCITDQMKAVCKICICMKRLVLHVIPKNQKCYIYFISYKTQRTREIAFACSEQEILHLAGENMGNCNFSDASQGLSFPLSDTNEKKMAFFDISTTFCWIADFIGIPLIQTNENFLINFDKWNNSLFHI